MCNLNIIINLKNKPILNCSFLSGTTAVSYDDNSHGDGIYFDNDTLIRSKDKLNLFNYLDHFKNSKLIITHQRFSTNKRTKKYTQPFRSSDFVIAHNGVLSSYAKKNKSDTSVVFNKFIKLFNKTKAKRETRIIKTIEKLFKDEYGSWSISLYDKKTKTLYYFKDSATKIVCYLNKTKDILYLSTKDDNDIFLNVFNDSFEEKEIDDYFLYKITFKNKIKIKKVRDLKKQKSSLWENKSNKKKLKKMKKLFHKWKGDKRMKKSLKRFCKHIKVTPKAGPCEYCQNPTKYKLIYSLYRVCHKCFQVNYYTVVKEERFHRDVNKGLIKPTAEKYLKYTGRESFK